MRLAVKILAPLALLIFVFVQRSADAAFPVNAGLARSFSSQWDMALPYPAGLPFIYVSHGLSEDAGTSLSLQRSGSFEFPSVVSLTPAVPEMAPAVRAVPRAEPLPRRLVAVGPRINFQSPVIEPFAHTRFCLQYPEDCKVRRTVFRGSAMTLTAERWAELNEVNNKVNRAIAFENNTQGVTAERWVIAPASGDCNDYAVTKRRELIARGWPARALLLAEVKTSWGEGHLVLVVHTKQGDYIADNLVPQIRAWSVAPYRWVRIQSPKNPHFWSTVARGAVVARATNVKTALQGQRGI